MEPGISSCWGEPHPTSGREDRDCRSQGLVSEAIFANGGPYSGSFFITISFFVLDTSSQGIDIYTVTQFAPSFGRRAFSTRYPLLFPHMRVGFVGLGAMGSGMARVLVSAGIDVIGFDVYTPAIDAFAAKGGAAASR